MHPFSPYTAWIRAIPRFLLCLFPSIKIAAVSGPADDPAHRFSDDISVSPPLRAHKDQFGGNLRRPPSPSPPLISPCRPALLLHFVDTHRPLLLPFVWFYLPPTPHFPPPIELRECLARHFLYTTFYAFFFWCQRIQPVLSSWMQHSTYHVLFFLK